MTFYTYQYFRNQNYSGVYIRIAIVSILLIAIIFFLYKYFKNRRLTKYRDLTVIFIVAALILVASQFQNFSVTNNTKNETNKVTGVLNQVAKIEKISKEDLQSSVKANSDSMIVRDAEKNRYYRILFDDQLNHFIIEKINIDVNNVQIKVVGE